MTQTRQKPQPIFGKQDQFNKIAANLLQGGFVIAVYDCIGAVTGFVGITDRRVIVQDNSFVGKKTALTSIPYSRVNAVSFVSDKFDVGLRVNLLDQRQCGRPRVPGRFPR